MGLFIGLDILHFLSVSENWNMKMDTTSLILEDIAKVMRKKGEMVIITINIFIIVISNKN